MLRPEARPAQTASSLTNSLANLALNVMSDQFFMRQDGAIAARRNLIGNTLKMTQHEGRLLRDRLTTQRTSLEVVTGRMGSGRDVGYKSVQEDWLGN